MWAEYFEVLASAGRSFEAHTPGRTGVLRILQAPGPGVVTAVHGVEAIRAMPETLELELFASAGTKVRPYTQAGNKIPQIQTRIDPRP